ncbi:MAG TPA: serine hydrolase, partial [Nitrolancea sp.]|nr:serine hydrolase [Nitrolancea sp.]
MDASTASPSAQTASSTNLVAQIASQVPRSAPGAHVAVAQSGSRSSPVAHEELVAPTETSTSAAAIQSLPTLALSAKAAYAVDLTNQTELYANNADQPLPPASTTKIVTAIVVVEHAQLGATVTVRADDTVDPTVYSHMGLEVGDVVTVRDLLAGMLLNSGGDAALSLSRYVGGQLPGAANEDPRQRFVDEM